MKDRHELKLYKGAGGKTAASIYRGCTFRVPRGTAVDTLKLQPGWTEKYRLNKDASVIGMKKVEGFKEVDPEAHRKKVAARNRKKRNKKIAYIAVQSVLMAIMLFALARIGEIYKGSVEGSEHRSMIDRMIFTSDSPEAAATPDRSTPPYPLATPQRIEYPVSEMPSKESLEALENINEDFVFWLYIPGTEVSYYVLQGETNSTYLRADIYRNYLRSGSCFLDYRNNAETMERHTIIYGHTMSDLSVFGELRRYLDEDFYRDHRYFYTCSTETVTMWRIFSVYYTTIDEYYIETYFRNSADYLEFINGLRSKSFYRSDTELVETDDVVTLSTCYRPYYGEDGRLVVHAVKVGTAPMV